MSLRQVCDEWQFSNAIADLGSVSLEVTPDRRDVLIEPVLAIRTSPVSRKNLTPRLRARSREPTSLGLRDLAKFVSGVAATTHSPCDLPSPGRRESHSVPSNQTGERAAVPP